MPRNALGVPGRASEWTPQQESVYARNAVSRFAAASPRTAAMGRQFFPTWQEDAEHIGQQASNPSTERGAAILARLSPATAANTNRLMAHQILTLDDHATAHIHAAAQHSAALASLRSKRPQSAGDADVIGSLEQQVKHHIRASGIGGTPLAMQSVRDVSKALMLRDGAHANPLEALGDRKIRDFGEAIATGGRTSRQTVDTHYHDAMLGRTDIPYATPRGLTSQGRYEGFSRAAERAHGTAVKMGLIEESPSSRQDFMATAWTQQQQQKLIDNPNALAARRADAAKTARMLEKHPHLDPARKGLRPMDVKSGLEF